MVLRDLAIQWLRANCPLQEIQTKILSELDRALDADVSCSFAIGRHLTRGDKAFLVYCIYGEVFVFQLTAEQAGRLGIADNLLVTSRGVEPHVSQPVIDPMVSIEWVKVDNGAGLRAGLDSCKPITGTLRLVAAKPTFEPAAIRAICEPAGRPHVRLYHHLFQLMPGADLRFTMPPLGKLLNSRDTPFSGAVPLFFQVVATDQRNSPPSFGPPLPGQFPHAARAPVSPPGWPKQLPAPAGTLKPLWLATTLYPPAYDPKANPTLPREQDRPLSDIRAVLVEIA